jgi:hypothetical protein
MPKETLVVPTFAHMLENFAFHVASIMTSKPTRTDAPYCNRDRFGLGMGNFGEGCPFVNVDFVIVPTTRDDPWGPWAQVYSRPYNETERNAEPNVNDGTWTCHGNRCGGRDAYARMVTPVLAWVAANQPSVKA